MLSNISSIKLNTKPKPKPRPSDFNDKLSLKRNIRYHSHSRNRDRRQLYYDILHSTAEPRKMTFVYKHQQSAYDEIKRCMLDLMGWDLLEKIQDIEGADRFVTTEKGRLYIQKMDAIYGMCGWIKVPFDY